MTLHLPVLNQCDRAIQKFDLIVPLAVQLPKTLRVWQQLCHKPERLPVYENVAARLLAPMPHNALPPQEALVGQRSSKPRWELNLNTRRLRNPDGQVVPLSNGEFSLLVVLLKPGTEEQWRARST